MNWISVEDRLPDTSRSVRVKSKIEVRGWYHIRVQMWFESDSGSRIFNPTHWCEVTEPSE